MAHSTQLKASDNMRRLLVSNKPNLVRPAWNGIFLDLVIVDAEAVKNISACNTENDYSPYRDSQIPLKGLPVRVGKVPSKPESRNLNGKARARVLLALGRNTRDLVGYGQSSKYQHSKNYRRKSDRDYDSLRMSPSLGNLPEFGSIFRLRRRGPSSITNDQERHKTEDDDCDDYCETCEGAKQLIEQVRCIRCRQNSAKAPFSPRLSRLVFKRLRTDSTEKPTGRYFSGWSSHERALTRFCGILLTAIASTRTTPKTAEARPKCAATMAGSKPVRTVTIPSNICAIIKENPKVVRARTVLSARYFDPTKMNIAVSKTTTTSASSL